LVGAMLALYIARLRDMSFSDGVNYVNRAEGRTGSGPKSAGTGAAHFKPSEKRFAAHTRFSLLGGCRFSRSHSKVR